MTITNVNTVGPPASTVPVNTKIAVDDLGATIGVAQYLKLLDGRENGTAPIPGDVASGLWVNVKAAVAQVVSGSVSVSNLPATQPVSGSVSVSNFPATQPISGSVSISGTPSVSVSNFPATQPVSGTVAVSSVGGTVTVGTHAVTISGTPSVSVSNWPATQPISGNVGVTGSVAVTGTFWQTTQPVSGSVSISGTPSVSVSNWPATQPISGNVGISGTPSVSVSNWPSTFPLAAGQAAIALWGHGVHTAAAPTSSTQVGAQVQVAEPNPVITTGYLAPLVADKVGKLLVLPYCLPENLLQANGFSTAAATPTLLIAAQAAGLRIYVTSLTVINQHATVGTIVHLTDGDVTDMWVGYAGPAGGGLTVSFPTPLKTSAAAALKFNTTSAASTIVSVSGYLGR